MTEIQQHDGVVVDARRHSSRASPYTTRGRGVAGEREAPRLKGAAAPSLPLIYIGSPRGAPALGDWISLGGGGQGWSGPQAKVRRPPTPRVSTLGAWGGPRGAHQPTMGWFPSPLWPMGPSGMGGPTRWTPGPFRWSRYNTGDPETCPDGRNSTSYI